MVTPPKGFDVHTLAFRRKWRSYAITVSFDRHTSKWDYRIDRIVRNAAVTALFYQEIGSRISAVAASYDFPNAEAAANAGMIAARMHFEKGGKT